MPFRNFIKRSISHIKEIGKETLRSLGSFYVTNIKKNTAENTSPTILKELNSIKSDLAYKTAMLDSLFNSSTDGKYCPVCKKSSLAFLPFGSPYRLNALCPFCNSLERHRLSILYLENESDVKNGGLKILHFAPEPFLSDYFTSLPNIDYNSADIVKGSAMQIEDIQRLSFKDQSFDFVYCSHVLEHVPDDHRAMKELFRVLKPTGWAFIMVPLNIKLSETFEDPNAVTKEERKRLYGQSDHVRIYGSDFAQRIEKAGFHVEKINYFDTLSPEKRSRMGLLPETIFCCRVSSNGK